MIKLKQTSPTGSDETAAFEVETDRETVADLVSDILNHKGDWGFIEIDGNKYEYRYGGQIGKHIPSEELAKRIEKITASGGWSRMDYYIETTTPPAPSVNPRLIP